MATTLTIEPTPLSFQHVPEHLNGSSGQDTAVEEKEKKLNNGERHDVSTLINYYKDPGDGSAPMPIRISDKTVKNERPSVAHPTIVRDITGEEGKYTLDAHGFQHCRRGSRLSGREDFEDAEKVKRVYYRECEELLRDVTGAPRVLIFDHKTRYGPSNWHKLGENNRAARGPLLRAHVDQSYEGAEIVLRRHLSSVREKKADEEGEGEEETETEAEERLRLGRRWMIVNIWRPIKTIYKDPFAVADGTSISDADLVAAQILYRDGSRDETWTILPPSPPSPSSPASSTTLREDDDEEEEDERTKTTHRWYFKYAQTPAEVLLIKCFDSSAGVPARRAPHSAFTDPAHEDGESRESIEARALVLFDE
ncbi:hypothetical protein F4810DRAFT_714164 [Camillea tinctor]|nr:hypothetical protein F4810DRAFT_714164 [Camillea tinctor]